MNTLSHLHSRYLDTSLHRVWVDEDNSLATFPLWNLSGQLLGYQQYRPNADKKIKNDPREGRYFTRLKEGKIGVWGLESFYCSNTLFVTEGIFDAARLSYFGYAAVALLSYDIGVSTALWLKVVRSYRRVVAVCDSDTSGRRLSKHGSAYCIVEGYKDLGEAPEAYVQDIIKEYSK
jgi:hypothetical protein